MRRPVWIDRVRKREASLESGREDVAPLAGFAFRKTHLGVPHRRLRRSQPQAAGQDRNRNRRAGGCLYLKSLADVDLDVLRRLVERSMSARRRIGKRAQAQ
jgi:hypothetical protein